MVQIFSLSEPQLLIIFGDLINFKYLNQPKLQDYEHFQIVDTVFLCLQYVSSHAFYLMAYMPCDS